MDGERMTGKLDTGPQRPSLCQCRVSRPAARNTAKALATCCLRRSRSGSRSDLSYFRCCAAFTAYLFAALQSRKDRLETRSKFTRTWAAEYYIVFNLGYEI